MLCFPIVEDQVNALAWLKRHCNCCDSAMVAAGDCLLGTRRAACKMAVLACGAMARARMMSSPCDAGAANGATRTCAPTDAVPMLNCFVGHSQHRWEQVEPLP